VKEKNGFWLLNPASKSESILLALLILFLPTQLGKHFWPSFSLVSGIRVDYLSPIIYTTDILIILLLFLCLWRMGITSLWNFFKRNLLLVIFLLFFLESALFALRPLLGFYWWFKLVEFSFLGYYIARTIRYPFQLSLVALLIGISSYLESLLAIFQYLSQSSLNGWLYYLGERTFTGSTPGIANASINGSLILRPYGTFSHPNVLAAYLLFSSLFVAFFLVRKTVGMTRAVSILMLLLNSVALVLSLSRVALALWFILLCSTIILYVFKTKSYRKALFFAGLAGSFIGVILLPFLKTLFLRFAQTSLTEEAYTQRATLITHTLTLIQQHPLTGVGLGSFIPALAPLQSALSIGLYLQPVHNIFLLIVSETGLIGFALFLWLLIRTYAVAIKKIKQQNRFSKEYAFFLLLVTCCLFLGLFDHYLLTLQQGALLFALSMGLCFVRFENDSKE